VVRRLGQLLLPQGKGIKRARPAGSPVVLGDRDEPVRTSEGVGGKGRLRGGFGSASIEYLFNLGKIK